MKNPNELAFCLTLLTAGLVAIWLRRRHNINLALNALKKYGRPGQ